MKIARHSKIIDLINQYDIETQEELAAKLVDQIYDLDRKSTRLNSSHCD